MKRFNTEHPADICFARGTFNAHPYVMGAMNVFLHRQETSEVKALYAELESTWETRKNKLNAMLEHEGLPVAVEAMSTVWSVLYQTPSRYNWLFQFYLRREGIALSWIGTGRMIFSLNFTEHDFDEFCQRFIRAAHQMSLDCWWWTPEGQTNKKIRRSMMFEMLKETKL